MILQQVDFNDFWEWLGRSDSYKNNFSYDGAKALFEYIEEASDNGEQEAADNYDPIAWCVEFSEYADFGEFQHDTGYTKDGVVYKGYDNIDTLEDLSDHTIVISESPLVIADF
jgi:hypothetical protein